MFKGEFIYHAESSLSSCMYFLNVYTNFLIITTVALFKRTLTLKAATGSGMRHVSSLYSYSLYDLNGTGTSDKNNTKHF